MAGRCSASTRWIELLPVLDNPMWRIRGRFIGSEATGKAFVFAKKKQSPP
jgi:hypothetical protein